METPALRATGLVKDYRRGRAVDGVTLTVAPGERVGLLGPNGAGKTTTLLMCLGVVRPEAGHVEILGHALPRERHRAMSLVGFAAGYLPLPNQMRVIEYLRMFGRLYGLRRPDVAARTGLERFGIGHLGGPWAPSCPAGRRRWSASSRRPCTGRACWCSTSRRPRWTRMSLYGYATGCATCATSTPRRCW